MRKFFAMAVATSMLGVAMPAAAQTANDDEFTGFYVGGSFGYGVQSNNPNEGVLFDRTLDGNFGDTIVTTTGANAFSTGFCNGAARGATRLPGGCENDRDDIEYFARAGYDQQFGRIVVGVVGEFGRSQVRDSVSAFSTTPANYVFTRELDWQASVRARAGFAADRTLFYGTFGPSRARIDNSFSSTNTANSFTENQRRTNSWGITGGGGIEQKIGDNFSFGLEYIYNRYNDDDYVVRVGPGTAPATNPFLLANAAGTDMIRSDQRFDFHSLRATAAFRF